jgi:hypothetical protein
VAPCETKPITITSTVRLRLAEHEHDVGIRRDPFAFFAPFCGRKAVAGFWLLVVGKNPARVPREANERCPVLLLHARVFHDIHFFFPIDEFGLELSDLFGK